MSRTLDAQLTELRQTIEMYKLAADRGGRASQSCCFTLGLESLEQCSRLVRLALTTSPSEEVVREEAQGEPAAFAGSGLGPRRE